MQLKNPILSNWVKLNIKPHPQPLSLIRIPMANQGYHPLGSGGVGKWGSGTEKTSPNYDNNPQRLAW